MDAIKNLIKKIVILFMSREKKEVVETFESYATAFLTFKPKNVLGYFEWPLVFLLDDSPADGPTILRTEEEVTDYLQVYMDDLQAKHYAKDVLTKARIKTLTKNVAVVSFHLVRVDTSGRPFSDMGGMYTLRKTDGKWRILMGILLSDGDVLPIPKR